MIRLGCAAVILLLITAASACTAEPVGGPAAPTGRSWPALPPEATDPGLVAQRLPQVGYQGGPFLPNPRIVTITFTSDDAQLVARLERFGNTITRSSWWRAVVEAYCVVPNDCIGEGSPGPHVHLDEQLPTHIRDIDVAALLTRAAHDGRIGPLERDTLLLVYLPEGVALADAFVPRYCADGPRAFHRALRLENSTIPYAVVPRCGGEADLTATASHEILESTTNPDPARRGFAFEQNSASLGFTFSGVEPVDPCGLILPGGNRTTQDGFTVQRAWSNRAAARGSNPCVPAPQDRPYLALVPADPTVRLGPDATP